MTGARLAFFKLNVAEMASALAFWRDAFGFAITASFAEPEFDEHILGLPGQEGGPNLMLVCWRDGRDTAPGPGHGPVGFACDDIAASYARAVAAGATADSGVFAVGPVQVALLHSPDGHEIELVQLPAA